MRVVYKLNKIILVLLGTYYFAFYAWNCSSPTMSGGESFNRDYVSFPDKKPQICIMNEDGSEVKIIATGIFPIFTPDGSKIIYIAKDRILHFYWPELDIGDISIIDTSGSHNLTLASGYGANYQGSPDRKEIVFTDGQELFLINVDGSGLTQLTNYNNNHFGRQRMSNPQFFPDGSKILYHYNICINTIYSDGSNKKLLTYGTDPRLTSDGKKIVFTNNDTFELSIMDTNGGNILRLGTTIHDAMYVGLSLSPDGKQILFTLNGQINIVDVDGKNLIKLADGANAKFSPDGTKIIYEFNDKIYIMNRYGNSKKQLTFDDVSSDKKPEFSPDGSKIVFYSLISL